MKKLTRAHQKILSQALDIAVSIWSSNATCPTFPKPVRQAYRRRVDNVAALRKKLDFH